MKRLLLLASLMLSMIALEMVLLLEPAVPQAAAYDGEARASLSCTDNTATMTRTVVVTVTWTGVGINRMEAQAWGGNPTVLLGSGSISFPPAKKGTKSLTFSFNDTTLFGTVQWQLYNEAIAPIQAGQLNASNFPGCPYP
jgi:hypothetical protein